MDLSVTIVLKHFTSDMCDYMKPLRLALWHHISGPFRLRNCARSIADEEGHKNSALIRPMDSHLVGAP